MKFFKSLFGILFPDFCPGCGKILVDDDLALCRECYAEIIREDATCFLCGFPASCGCPMCGSRKLYFDKAYSFAVYAGVMKKVVAKLKTDRSVRLASFLAKQVCLIISRNFIEFDCILYVPASPKNRKKRGFDQGEILARAVSAVCSVPYFRGAVIQKRSGTQKKLHYHDRFLNSIGGFECARAFHGRKILLLDDVFTTGSTLNEIARTLKLGGAVSVHCVVIARVPEAFFSANNNFTSNV